MIHKNQHQKMKSILPAVAVLVITSLMTGTARAGTLEASSTAPVPGAEEVYLYNQASGIESGKIIALKKLIKDVQDYPANGSASVLLTFTAEGSGMALVKSMSVQISKSDMALGNNAVLEVALYRNADPADDTFAVSEVVGEIETFDASGLIASDGDYITFSFDQPVSVEAGVQYGFALHWTLDSVAPDSIDIDTLNLRLARANDEDVKPGEGYILLNPPNMAPVSFPPEFSTIKSEDPILIIIGEISASGSSWGGIAAEASDPNLVDTGDWMGWIYVDGDWVFSYSLTRWLYAPDPGTGAPGAWVFAGK